MKNRNNLSLKELKEIIPIIKINNVLDNEVFDYFRIAGLNNIRYEDFANNTLFFFSYCKKEDLSGWYINEFDYRLYTENIINDNPNFTFVIEKEQEKLINNKNIKYIVVDNVNVVIDLLFDYVMKNRKAKTISVTGSVGKTTCIGLLEKVLKEKYNVLRIYSKRVTPIILKANVINFLTDEIDYIVMEFSIFYHDHVQVFTDYLKPFIAGIINIESSHMGIDLLNTIDDICFYKSIILKYAKYGFVNGNDEYLKELSYKNNLLTYKDKVIIQNNDLCLEKLDLNNIVIKNNEFCIDNVKWKPFIFSNLAKIQYYIVYKIAKTLNIGDDTIIKCFNSYLPVENRMHEKIAFDKNIIFDGDITTYERIKELSDNYYDNKYLILRKVGSSENTLRIKNIKEYFNCYKKVYIFDDVEYLKYFKDEKNIEIVNNHDFMKDIDGIIIYHYSGYFRSFKEFNEDNLKIYDDKIYKIKMED